MADARRIAELADRLGRIAHGLQFAEGLNPAQWEALRFLARANKYSCSPGALADFLGVTKGTASQTLIALEAKGYISRSRCDHDRRSVAICVTEKGNALLQRDPLHCLENATGALAEDDIAALADGMELLVRNLQRKQGRPEFGACVRCEHFQPENCQGSEGVHCRCALTGDLLTPEEQHRICVDFNTVC